ncbi:hypothetical protein O7616_09590 [Micromonospora sp. WMMD964]|nr:hypothetical protein [Micromonospora sp. WMMD964]WFF04234.1 hypothetical protein O7616_09590 [Micromonospora sp. WMMD964]
MARQMIAAAVDAEIPFAWRTGNEVYGTDPGLRADLEHCGIGYALAFGCDRRVTVNDGRSLMRVDELAERIPPANGSPTSAGRTRKVPATTCGPGSPRPPTW